MIAALLRRYEVRSRTRALRTGGDGGALARYVARCCIK
jgi:hypothetical protein